MSIDFSDFPSTSDIGGGDRPEGANRFPGVYSADAFAGAGRGGETLSDSIGEGLPYALAFGGQGIEWLASLAELTGTGLVAERLDELVAHSEAILAPVADELAATRPAGFRPLQWAEAADAAQAADAADVPEADTDDASDTVPDAAALAAAAVSMPAVFLTQLGAMLRLAEEGLHVHEVPPVAAVGHSQGVLAVESLDTFGANDAELLAVAALVGAAATLHGRRAGLVRRGPASPMRQVSGASREQLEALIAEALPMHGEEHEENHNAALRPVVSIRNDLGRHVVVGRPADLDVLEALCADRAAESRARREAKLTGGDPFDPSFDGLDVEVGFHHPALAGAVAQVREWADAAGIDAARAERLARAILTDEVDWVAELDDAAHAGARWVLDMGPGTALERLDFSVLRGYGIGTLAAGSPAGLRALFTPGAAPQVERPWSAHQPRLVRLPGGSVHVETSFTRLTGTSPVMLAGMTPTTVDPAIVAAAANAGHWAELAGGGQVTEEIFAENTARLAALLEPGRTAQFNSLFLDPYLWNLQVGGKRLVQKARAAGLPIDGVVVTAGIPDLPDAVELVRELRDAGIRHVSFKPGTVAQIRDVVRIAAELPEVPIIVQVEGGAAGGHHSWEALDDLLLRTYGELRGRPNVVLAVGGGIGTPERAADYLTGQWSLAHGHPSMPVDAVLVGTAAMAAKEATTSPQVKELLVATAGIDGWVGAGQATGGMASGRSQLGADIHEIDNSAARTGRLLDEVAGDADAVAARREEIVAAVNATAKPYFGDLEEMSYKDVLERFAELCRVADTDPMDLAGLEGAATVFDVGSDFGESIDRARRTAWLDVSLRERFHALVQRTEARLDPRDRGGIASAFPTVASVENPETVVDILGAHYPEFDSAPLHPADVAEFLRVCRMPGKPVPFVPVIDGDVRRWWRSDSLWQAHDPRFPADAVCVIPGTVSVAGIERADEPVGEILGRFEEAAIRRIAVAQPDVDAVSTRRRATADGPDTPVATVLASPDIVWAGRVVPNPALRIGAQSEWLLDDDARAHHPDSGASLRPAEQGSDVVLEVPVGRATLSIVIELSDGVATGALPVVTDEAAASAMRTLLRTAAGVDELPEVVDGHAEAEFRYSGELLADHSVVTAAGLQAPLSASAGVPDALVGPCWPAIFAVIGASRARSGGRVIDVVEGLLDLVHLDHSVQLREELPAACSLRADARARTPRDTGLGRIVEVTVDLRGASDGVLYATLRERFAIRGRTGSGEAGEPNRCGGALVGGETEGVTGPRGARSARVEPTTRQRRALVELTAPADMTAFAAVSGDHNPIHVSTTAARLAGLGGVIVHGMWLSAAAQHAVQALSEDSAGAPPLRIVGWTARMLAPVRPGARVQIRAEQTGRVAGGTHLGGQILEVTCAVDGSPAMTATAVTAPPRTAYVFPGQGIQSAGMGMAGRNRSRAARRVWDRADEHTRSALGFSILAIVRDNPGAVTVRGTTYRHPDGVLNLTQFTQVAMACLAVAQVAELSEDGLFQDGAFFAGHSVGEYTALAAISGTLSLESLLEIVFQRGLAMHTLVPRDAEGNSDYRLAAIRPSQMGVADADVSAWVAKVAEDSGEYLEIVNYNLAGSQYAIAGTVAGCEALEAAVADAVERHGGKAAFVLIPGIDVPFHSSVLRDGVPEFRATLESLIPHDDIDIDVLVGRYIPNLVPRPFSLDRDFVEEIAAYVPSEPLENVLDTWEEWERQPRALGRLLLIELLAWQFASPVRWIETQDLLFSTSDAGGLGITQCVEVGVASAPTLSNLAAKTLALPGHRGSSVRVVNIERDAAALWGTLPPSVDEVEEDDEGSAEVESSAPQTASAPAPQAQAPADQASAAPGAPRPADLPFDAGAATTAIVALRTKLRTDQITPADTIEVLCDGVSSRRNQLLVDLGTELGLGAIDGAAEAEFSELTATTSRMARAYRAFGPVLGDAVGDALRPLLGRSGKRQSYITDRVTGTWKLGEGWGQHVLAQLALGTRDGDSTRGGELSLFDSAASATDAAGLDALIDAAVREVGSEHGVDVAMPASEAAGGATVDAAALGEFAEEITGRDGALATAARTLLTRLGHLDVPGADGAGSGIESGTGSEMDAEFAELVSRELGSDWRRTIAPAFDARRAVLLDDRWASAREDLARIWTGELSVAPSAFAGMGEAVATQAAWWADRAAVAGMGELVRSYTEIAGYARAGENHPGEYADQCAVVTGAGPGSIASAVIAELLAGGATVIATTSSLSPKRLAFYKDLYRANARAGAALWAVPANLASFGDVDELVEWIGAEQSETLGAATEITKPALLPTLLFPFAAPRVQGSAADAGPRAETEMRVLLWGVERLVTGLGGLGADTAVDERMHVVLPGSPNRGIFGGDGAYGEAKAALDALVAKWGSERSWGERVTIAHALIGWVRGTGLMGHNDPLVAEVEAAGVRTWSTDEIAVELLRGCSPGARAEAAKSPITLDLTGGLGEAELDMAELAAARPDAATDEPDEQNRRALSALPNLPHAPSGPRPDWGEVSLPLEDMVVVVGTGELGPYGSARTRFEAEATGELSAAGVVELAWSTGLIEWEDGPKPGWALADSGEPIAESEIAERLRDEVLARVGIRQYADDGEMIDNSSPLLSSVFLDSDLTFAAADEAEARAYAEADPDGTVVGFVDGEWLVTRRAGTEIRVPRRATLTRVVGGQIPTGFDPRAWGIGADMADSLDRVAAWNLVATVDAFLSSGFTPAELLAHVHPAEVANTQGTGMGGMSAMRSLYIDGILGRPRQGDILQEALPNVVAAHVMQSYVGGYGAMVHPVAACATAAVSVEEGFDKIRGGKAEFVVAGGFDDLSIEGIQGFADMSATADSAAMAAKGISERHYSRAGDRRRDGFVESQGGGTVLLARGDVAAEMGLPVHGVVAWAGSYADGAHTSIPAPGLGALGAGRGGRRSRLARSLASLGMTPDDLAFVSKHDTSTKANDPNEADLHERLAAAIGRTEGNPLFVVSQKTLTGHAKGGAAAFQLIGLCQVLRSGILPPNRALDCVDDAMAETGHLVWLREPLELGESMPLRGALLTSLGFGHVSGLIAVAHPEAYYAAVAGELGEERASAVRARADEREQAGAWDVLRGIYGGGPLYTRPVARRLGEDGTAAEIKNLEAAMLLSEDSRVGADGVLSASGGFERGRRPVDQE